MTALRFAREFATLALFFVTILALGGFAELVWR